MSKRNGIDAVTASVPNRRGTADSDSGYHRSGIRTRAIMVVALMLIAAVFGALAVSDQSNAADGEAEGIAYTITDGAMAITCTSGGTMPNYDPGEAPWYGDRASITSITIASDITTIGDFAFYGLNNSAFTSYTIPAQITSVGIGAFGDCSSLASFSVADTTYFNVSDGVLYKADYSVLIAYPCAKSGTVFDIPTTAPFERNTLQSVQEGAFIGASNITEFTNEGSNDNFRVDSVGALYSYNKVYLYRCPTDTSGSYSIMNGSINIVAGAFDACSNISEIRIAESVAEIDTMAFSKCSGLTFVNIPPNVVYISPLAFEQCTNLSEIIVDALNEKYYSDEGVLFEYESKTLIKFPIQNHGTGSDGNTYTYFYIVPYGVEKIGEYAFVDSLIKYCTLTEKVTTLGYKAFYNTKLEQIQFNMNLSTLETKWQRSLAFAHCAELKMASVSNALAVIPEGTFADCAKLTVFVVDYADQTEIKNIACEGALPTFTANQYYWFAGPTGSEESVDFGYVLQDSDLTAVSTGQVYSKVKLTKFTGTKSNCWGTYGWNSAHYYTKLADGSNHRLGLYTVNSQSLSSDFYLNDTELYRGMMQTGLTSTINKGFRECNEEYLFIPETVTYVQTMLSSISSLKYLYFPESVTGIHDNWAYRAGSLVYVGISPSSTILSTDANICLNYNGKIAHVVGATEKNTIIPPGVVQTRSAVNGGLNSWISPESLEQMQGNTYSGTSPSGFLISAGNATGVFINGKNAGTVDFSAIESTHRYTFRSQHPGLIILPASHSEYTFNFASNVAATAYVYTVDYNPDTDAYTWTSAELVDSSVTHASDDGLSNTIISMDPNLDIKVEYNAEGDAYFWFIRGNSLIILGQNVDITLASDKDSYPWDSVKSSIKYVDVQEGIIGIGDGAFSDFTNLTACKVAYSVERIGKEAFRNCGSTTSSGEVTFDSIFIPGKVVDLADDAFRGCSHLKRIIVSDLNDVYSSEDGVLFSEDLSKIIYCPEGKRGVYAISDSVLSLAPHSFHGSSLESIDLGTRITIIPDYTFYGSSIDMCNIPDQVETIGAYAFFESDLSTAIIGDEVNNIGVKAFPDNLELFSLTNSDTTIDWNAASLPSDDEWYRDYYFSISHDGAIDYSKIIRGHIYSIHNDLPDTSYDISAASDGSLFAIYNAVTSTLTVTNMSDLETTTMRDFVYDDTDPQDIIDDRGWASYLNSIQYVNFSAQNLENVGDNMLRSIPNIHSVSFSHSIVSIGDYSFCDMANLESLSVGSKLEAVGLYAFAGDSSLTSIEIGSSLKSIGDYAFFGTAIASVEFPATLETIGAHAFETTSLRGTITIPNGVRSIGDYAFYRTASSSSGTISVIVIGSSVTEIGNYAFAGHGAVASVLVRGSSGNVSLGDHVFSTYASSDSVVYTDLQFKLEGEGEAQALTSSVEKGTFWIIDGSSALKLGSNINAYVADGFVFISGSGVFYSLDDESFTDKDAWLALEVKEIVISGVTNIGTSTGAADLFQQSNVTSNLTSLSLYDAVRIPAGAFSSCSGLVHIAIPVAAFAPTVGYSPVIFSMGADAFDLAALDSIDTVSNEGVSTFELSGEYAFEQAGNLIIVKNAVWQDSDGNWATSFQDGGSYRPIELSGYVSNGYTASLTTTM